MNYSDIIVSPSLRPPPTEMRVEIMERNVSNVSTLPSRRPRLNRSENRINSLHDECDSKISVVDRFSMKERLQSRNATMTKEQLRIATRSDSLEKLHMGIVLPSGNKQHSRWLQHVKRLKHGQKSSQFQLPRTLDIKSMKLKPFGNFVNTKPVALESVSQGKTCEDQRQESCSDRRVTFNIDNSCNQPHGISIHTVSSGTSRSTESSNNSHKKSEPIDHSNHKCAKVTSRLFNKRTSERRFWSRKDMERQKARSRHRANAFRVDFPATVKQLSKIFLDTCNKSSTYNKDFVYGDDEDQEEMLRDFLRDWAASNVRGLEELVTGRHMFTDTRKMAVQSVLAYQQTLKENLCATEVHRMADLLRARSESTSQRARMFAMYLALGDALVANANNNEQNDFDDADISIHME